MYSVLLAGVLAAGAAETPAWGCGISFGFSFSLGGHCGCCGCGCCGCGWCGGCGCHCWSGCHHCWGCHCGGYPWWAHHHCGCSYHPWYVAYPVAVIPVAAVESPANTAVVSISVPEDATLSANGQNLTLTGARRTFATPELDPNKTYYYTFKAEVMRDGSAVSETKRIDLRAGETKRIDWSGLGKPPADPKVGSSAMITVQLPADAKLFVNDVLCPLTGDSRVVETPGIRTGRDFAYQLRATVERDGQTRKAEKRVVLRSGERLRVALSDFSPSN